MSGQVDLELTIRCHLNLSVVHICTLPVSKTYTQQPNPSQTIEIQP